MKVAYLIMAHNAPQHARRLVESLRHPDATVFMHIDAKVDITPFLPLSELGVRFTTERVKVLWADYSQCAAIFTLMRAALAAPEQPDRLVLLSGADLPLRSANELMEYFEEHPRTEFIDLVRIPNIPAVKLESRLTDRFYPKTLFGRVANRLMRFGVIPRHRDYRPAFGGLIPYGGSEWWALTGDCGRYVLDQVAQRPELIRFIKGTACSDETLIQTLVANSPFAPNMVRALTYTRWRPGAISPDTLAATDLPALMRNPVYPSTQAYGSGTIMFARKFSEDTSAAAAALVRAGA